VEGLFIKTKPFHWFTWGNTPNEKCARLMGKLKKVKGCYEKQKKVVVDSYCAHHHLLGFDNYANPNWRVVF